MGNALPQVRACADMVTDTVENDGIAHALQKLKLIG
jgi:hydroxymethylpyrimidine pyrophosphatase-like HAD family hydrolase